MGKTEIKKATKSAIKTVDRVAIVTDKAKNIAVKTKDDLGEVVSTKADSPQEYAAQRVTNTANKIKDDTVIAYNKIGYHSAKKTIRDTPKTIEEVREHRIAQQAKRETEKKVAESSQLSTTSTVKATNDVKTANAIKKSKQNIKKAERITKVKTFVKSNPTLNNLATTKSAKRAINTAKYVRAKLKASQRHVERFIKAMIKVIRMALKSMKSMIVALIGGSWIAVLIIVILAIAGGIAASCYGIFFSNEDSETGIIMRTVVQEINQEYQDAIENEKSRYTYDDYEIVGSQANWEDVLTIYAIKTNIDQTNPMEVATIDNSKKQLLRNVFWDMNSISSSTTTTTTTNDNGTPDDTTDDTEETKTSLTITLSSKSADEMTTQYSFNDEQKSYVSQLLAPSNGKLWLNLIYGITSISNIDIGNLTFENETANDTQKQICVVATNYQQYGIVPVPNHCQGWVADVYQRVYGSRGSAHCALCAADMWAVSSDWSSIPVGATVYGYASNPYGHVGIYIGNGMVIHNLSGNVISQSLDSWVTQFKGFSWGWEYEKVLK